MKNILYFGFGYFVGGVLCSYAILNILKRGANNVRSV